MLAGLPRIVRAGDEVRWRGELLMSLGLASAAYWTVLWLVDGPVNPAAAGIVADSVPEMEWKETEVKARASQVALTQAQRDAVARLYAKYNEALVARAAVDNARRIADLAAESLRLTNLRYGAGESTALEVVDAQNTLVQARNAYDDAGARYRVALADLQTVTGAF